MLDKARALAHGLGIPVWVMPDGRCLQYPEPGAERVDPLPTSAPTPHGGDALPPPKKEG